MSQSPLHRYLADETAQAAPSEVRALYDSFCARMPVPQTALAGLFYGSALWKTPAPDSVWDLYVLVENYAGCGGSTLLQRAGRALPPNVYYHETTDAAGTVLRGKIAVMTLKQFERHCRGRVLAPQTWARFAQPVRLIAVRDDIVRGQVVAALAQAVLTFHRATAPWVQAPCSIAQFWQMGLQHTYASEWRAERGNRQQALVAASLAAFTARSTQVFSCGPVAGLALDNGQITRTMPAWQAGAARATQRGRDFLSRVQHALRLMKAAFTFAGGVDYLAYKIARHSGVTLTPSAFARRHPLLGVWPLVVQGLRARAFR
ncbi:MAG: hypothetical protein SFW64_00780 [Alphaproteobacteria bacterium]|nr:hypothetical protein [Alphaproteobacteria bacterium]